MNRGNEVSWGNPMPGFPQAPSAARSREGNPMPGLAAPSMGAPDGRPHRSSQAPSAARGVDGVPPAPEASSTNRPVPQGSEYSRPRRPQR